MSFDFTIAIIPNNSNLDIELQYIKSALLYADKVTLISPLAYLFTELTDKKYKDTERKTLHLFNQILPLCKLSDEEFYNQSAPVIAEFSRLISANLIRQHQC